MHPIIVNIFKNNNFVGVLSAITAKIGLAKDIINVDKEIAILHKLSAVKAKPEREYPLVPNIFSPDITNDNLEFSWDTSYKLKLGQ